MPEDIPRLPRLEVTAEQVQVTDAQMRRARERRRDHDFDGCSPLQLFRDRPPWRVRLWWRLLAYVKGV